MNIKSITIKNILSIESAHLQFEESGLVLVEGWNADAQRSNGAGKTAIFNALAFALFDKVPRKITASEIIRRGEKKGEAECEVFIGEDIWTVTRSRPKGVIFKRNDQVVDITQVEWESKLRLSYDQFLVSTYAAQQQQTTRFISLNDSDKKNFLLQLLDLNEFQQLKKEADTNVKILNAEIQDIDLKINAATSKIEAYSESIIDETLTKNLIDALSKEIDHLKNTVIDYQKVQKPDIQHFSSIEKQICEKEQAISMAKAEGSLLRAQYKALQNQIKIFDKADKCKECGSPVDTQEAKAQHSSHQESILESITSLRVQIEQKDQIISKSSDILNLKAKITHKKNQDSEQYNKALFAIQDVKSLISKKNMLLESHNIKLSQNSELLNKIRLLKEVHTKLSTLLSGKHSNIEFYKTLASIYSPTGAQAYVLDSIVDKFNNTVIDYISLVWPTATYILNSHKESSSGDIVAKFSESLIIDGRPTSVGSLSGGELKALSLCIDFTVIDILQSNFGIRINPIILDEPFDGLDAIGKEIVLELLEKLGNSRQIFVVDHGSEAKSMFSKTVFVTKKNGVSTVKVDA